MSEDKFFIWEVDGDRYCAAQFSPESLKLSISNSLGEEGNSKQNTKPPKASLEVTLIFDATEDGADVRERLVYGTQELKQMALADPKKNNAPPQVEVEWGNFSFIGVIESLTETLDFWSSEGIPLRSSIALTIQGIVTKDGTQLDMVTSFETFERADSSKIILGNTDAGSAKGTTKIAEDAGAKSGDSGPARDIAKQNGLESMRFPGGAGGSIGASASAGVSVSAGVELKAAAGFSLSAGIGAGASIGFGFGAAAGGGASLGLGGGIGAGISGGIGGGITAGASAGFGASVGANFGASASAGFGASASAGFGADIGFSAGAAAGFSSSSSGGITGSADSFSQSSYSIAGGASLSALSASEGAFAGLSSNVSKTESYHFSTDKLLPPPAPPMPGGNAAFDVSGKMVGTGSGFKANVSGSASASVQIL